MGMLFGGWYKEMVEEYGSVENYHNKMKEYLKDNPPQPTVWSTTEPYVAKGDVIAKGISEDGKAIDEAYVERIENGEPYVSFLNKDSGIVKWEGSYSKVCTTIN